MPSIFAEIRVHLAAIRTLADQDEFPSLTVQWAIKDLARGLGLDVIYCPKDDHLARLREAACAATAAASDLRHKQGPVADVDIVQILRWLISEALAIDEDLGLGLDDEEEAEVVAELGGTIVDGQIVFPASPAENPT